MFVTTFLRTFFLLLLDNEIRDKKINHFSEQNYLCNEKGMCCMWQSCSL